MITGTIADAGKLDGDFPLAGATVWVQNGPAITVTNLSGAFSLYADPERDRASPAFEDPPAGACERVHFRYISPGLKKRMEDAANRTADSK
ncbi:MAG: hypothetical protein IT186_05730 [Acidobacteria bacterium]|nr:hypothetical protein [Acidobacteriota bacterium]